MKQYKNIDEYLRNFKGEGRVALEKMRETIHAVVPNAVEAIAYGIPTFKLNGRNLVHFAGWEKHVGFYPGASGVWKFQKELAKYETSKGTVKFPLEQKIPYGLIKKITAYRVKEERARTKEKR